VIPSIALRYGGPSVAMRAMATALAAADVDVTVVSTNADGPGALDVPLDRPLVENGVSYRYFARTVPGEWKLSLGLARWVRAHAAEFDVVHVHALFSYTTIPGCHAARAARVPYIVRPLGTLGGWSLAQKSWKKRPYMALVERPNLEHASAIHVAEGAEIVALGFGATVRNIPLGVPVAAASRPAERAAGPFRLLFLSRVHPKKGLPLLFDALRRVRASGVEVHLDVVGGGDPAYVRELVAAVSAAGLDAQVRFVGELQGEAKRHAFAQADAYVLPSSNENFGIAVAEALAASLPVVISDQVGIADDVLAAGAGLVTTLDAGELANAIAALAGDPVRRSAMAVAARKLALDRYSWDETARRLVALYRELAAGRGRRPAHPVQ
jgi:glycosyltransferase involved in cell wall biosynthesis